VRVFWTIEAQRDRADIFDYIAGDNPQAAIRTDELFSKAIGRLTKHPMVGRMGHVEGTRELIVHKSYRLVYEIVDDTVWVLTLVHTARQWPPVRD
jgi:toxin ParE1/3/4